jgi:MFS family permease
VAVLRPFGDALWQDFVMTQTPTAVGVPRLDFDPSAKFRWAKIFPSVYLPTTLYEAGVGAMMPVLPMLAVQLGASPAQAALVISLEPIGQVFGDIPAGHFATKVGDRKAMLFGAVVTAACMLAAVFAHTWILLALATLIMGAVSAIFALARQSYLSEVIPPQYRSRALSMLGGMQRTGSLIGPFLGGFAITALSRFVMPAGQEWLRSAIWLAILLTAITGVVVAITKDVEVPNRIAPIKMPASVIFRNNWRMFATLGVAFIIVGALRQTRLAVLPLWSQYIGLSGAAASYLLGISGILDVALFYPGGRIMDKRGRMWVAVPSVLVLGAALIALPFTHSFVSIALVALVMGLGNGLGSGMIMTISADMAKPAERTQFLSICRLFSDGGSAVGPLVIAASAAGWLLGGGIILMGLTGLAAAAILAITLPKHTPHANRRTRLLHGLSANGD